MKLTKTHFTVTIGSIWSFFLFQLHVPFAKRFTHFANADDTPDKLILQQNEKKNNNRRQNVS